MYVKVLIVDDNPMIRHSLRSWIEQNTDWKVCGEAENGAVAVEEVKALNPTVVILDLSMPVMNGLEAARHIASIAPATLMIMFTMFTAEPLLAEARSAGIRHVVSKSDGPSVLLASIKTLLINIQGFSDIRWNPGTHEWFCARCGRTSDRVNEHDARLQFEQYDCKPPVVETHPARNSTPG